MTGDFLKRCWQRTRAHFAESDYRPPHHMSQPDPAAAWHLFATNWLLLAGLAAALAVSVVVSDFSFAPLGALVTFCFVAIYTGVAYYNAKAPHRRDPQVVYVLGATGQIVFATAILAPLSYVAAATNLPMQDANLQVVDQALGLDWLGYVKFVNDRPLLAGWLQVGYTMIGWPIFFTPVVLAAAGHYLRLQEFVFAFTVALAVTVIVSALVPAIGVFHHLGLAVTDFANIDPGAYSAQLRDLPLVRDGSLRRLRTARACRTGHVPELPCGVRRALRMGVLAGALVPADRSSEQRSHAGRHADRGRSLFHRHHRRYRGGSARHRGCAAGDAASRSPRCAARRRDVFSSAGRVIVGHCFPHTIVTLASVEPASPQDAPLAVGLSG